MSATGRGAVKRDSEFYPTPPETTLAILRHVALPGGRWLEPSAGEGAIIRAVNAVRSDVEWTACEIRPECAAPLRSIDASPVVGDFLNLLAFGLARFDVAILNPPFSVAVQFIMRCLSVAEWVVCLQRINFLGSGKRNRFWREHMPDVYVLPNRPSFVDGATDATEYAWFVWPPGAHNRNAGRVEVLPTEPGQERIEL